MDFLARAKSELEKVFNFVAESRVYSSPAVDYENQPDFLNQVLQFELPNCSPDKVMRILLAIEEKLGRKRDIPKGPRTIDLDIIFYGLVNKVTENVTLPHPALFKRSFVVLPLQELPYYATLSQKFEFPSHFDVIATPIIN